MFVKTFYEYRNPGDRGQQILLTNNRRRFSLLL